MKLKLRGRRKAKGNVSKNGEKSAWKILEIFRVICLGGWFGLIKATRAGKYRKILLNKIRRLRWLLALEIKNTEKTENPMGDLHLYNWLHLQIVKNELRGSDSKHPLGPLCTVGSRRRGWWNRLANAQREIIISAAFLRTEKRARNIHK